MPIQSAAPPALRQRVPRAAWSLLLATFFAAGALPVAAQPSGGPYGPVAKSYEVPVAANVYYVAPAGDANAPGTTLARPTTIESAIARVVTGDVIVMRGGTYRSGLPSTKTMSLLNRCSGVRMPSRSRRHQPSGPAGNSVVHLVRHTFSRSGSHSMAGFVPFSTGTSSRYGCRVMPWLSCRPPLR